MMDNRKMVTHSMQGAFVFVLLGLFAVMSTLMVLLGAQMYRNTVDHATANNQGRESGTAICPAKHFVPKLDGGLLTVFVVNAEDEMSEVRVGLRCAG